MERLARVERWTPPPPQQNGEPGSRRRLPSDYEDAIYAEARYAVAAQFGNGDEQQHAALAAQLHGDVRRLRGRILDELETVTIVNQPSQAVQALAGHEQTEGDCASA